MFSNGAGYPHNHLSSAFHQLWFSAVVSICCKESILWQRVQFYRIYRCVATTPGFFLHGLWLCNSYPQAWSSTISLAIRLYLWTPRLNIGDIPKDGLPWWMPKRRCCLRRARGLGTVARDPGVTYKHRQTSWTWLSQWAYPSLLFGWPLHVVSQRGWVSYWVGPIIPASGIIWAPRALTYWLPGSYESGCLASAGSHFSARFVVTGNRDLLWLLSSDVRRPTHCFRMRTRTPRFPHKRPVIQT